MSSLKEFLYKRVRIISTDARLFEGKLEGFDNSTNVVISSCVERILRESDSEEPYQELELGVYMVRGTNVVCIGEVEDNEIKWSEVVGSRLKGTKNPV